MLKKVEPFIAKVHDAFIILNLPNDPLLNNSKEVQV